MLDMTGMDMLAGDGGSRLRDRELSCLEQLTPAMFHVLLALADGERHGYAIMQEVESRTDGEVQLRTPHALQ